MCTLCPLVVEFAVPVDESEKQRISKTSENQTHGTDTVGSEIAKSVGSKSTSQVSAVEAAPTKFSFAASSFVTNLLSLFS